jgi:hypothetical protein
MGKPPRDVFLVQLREAREEWFRRKKTKASPASISQI